MMVTPVPPPKVEAALAAFPDELQKNLRVLRRTIFDVAERTEGIGQITESLKWGQPSFEAVRPKSGTPLRIGVTKTGDVALFAHCQTTVIPQARDIFADLFRFEGNRALLLPVQGDWPDAPLRQVIRSALTYRLAAASDRSR